jgi:hypothetical protein
MYSVVGLNAVSTAVLNLSVETAGGAARIVSQLLKSHASGSLSPPRWPLQVGAAPGIPIPYVTCAKYSLASIGSEALLPAS